MAERPKITVPSIEAIEYGRRVIQPVHDLLKEWEAKALSEGDEVRASKFRFTAFMIQTKLLGHDDGGCVITSFDKRWLDPKFRQAMEAI